MRIDWDAFTSEITTLMKTSGDTGDSGDTSRNKLENHNKSVTARFRDLSPLVLTGDTHVTVTGDALSESKQSVTEPVTGVTAVTAQFQQGAAPFTDCVRKLRATPAPEAFWGDRWQCIIDDSAAFVATWGEQAKHLGWTEIDLFAAHPTRAACRFDLMGLVPLIDGGEVVALTDATAMIKKPSGSIQRHTRRQRCGAVLLWEVR